MKTKPSKAWVVAVDMGYGHERAAYALRDLAYQNVIIANRYPGIPRFEAKHWRGIQDYYEKISRFKNVPVMGDLVFEVMDHFQEILPFYPRRDLSAPTVQLKQTYDSIKKDLGKRMIDHAKKANSKLPFIGTFFQAAYTAEEFDYPGDI